MGKKEVKYLSKAEFTRLRNQIKDDRDQLILDVLYETGCTVNELVHIQIFDVDFTNGVINVRSENTKSHRSRKCFVSKKLVSTIKKLGKVTYILATRQSSQITTKRVRQLIQYYSKKAKLGKINPQVIRYTHIAHALEKGIPLTAIQKQVGMERLRMVQIYEALVPEEKEGYERFFK